LSSFAAESDNRQTIEIVAEQAHLTRLYERLDVLREQAGERLSAALKEDSTNQQQRSLRDSLTTRYADQIAVYHAVENGLCFGRLDFDNSERLYIGRLGMFDETAEHEPLLIDWRAPAARDFYLATAASPGRVRRRRHLRTKQRTVVGLDDEVLDLAAVNPDGPAGLTGEATLLAAVGAARTGRMRDIVETIQVEQDAVIRAPMAGTLVVQGGPGTGKTAVALHRAAYLLYTHREELTARGVLIVGPNTTFLRYIAQVLPSLAETGVLLATLGDLYPGITARRFEGPHTAALKGDPAWAEIIAAAISDRQTVPEEPIEIEFEQETLLLYKHEVEAARLRTRRAGKLHNLARPQFEAEIVHVLAEQLSERIGTDPYADDPLGGNDAPGDPQLLSEADLAELRGELRASPQVQAAINELWPVLTPQRLLADLYAEPDRLASAAPGFTEAQRALLHRAPGGGWSPADVALLDEAAHQLGEDESAEGVAARRRRAARIAYAQGALDIAAGSASMEFEDEEESELLNVGDLLEAERYAERFEVRESLTAAQRAAADRSWAFGHVIVDEAQELSPMAWRLLMRRCPSRSMTIVGDVAQTGDLAGAASWGAALEPYLADRWRHAELTVNYRTPAEIMDLAAKVLAEIDPSLTPPRSVRATGEQPWREQVTPQALGPTTVRATVAQVAAVGDGRVGVIVPEGELAELGGAVQDALPEAAVGADAELERRVVVLTVRQAKGLEFDSVIVVDPDRIVADSPHGRSDLYVALTRATRHLGLICPTPAEPAAA
jgi:DNA helicase IV